MTSTSLPMHQTWLPQAEEEGNQLNPLVYYIVSEHLAQQQSLPCYISFNDFLIQALEQRLPAQKKWVLGQGLTLAQQHTIKQLQPFLVSHDLILSDEEKTLVSNELCLQQFQQIDTASFEAEILMSESHFNGGQSDGIYETSLLMLQHIAAMEKLGHFDNPHITIRHLNLSKTRTFSLQPIKVETIIKTVTPYKDLRANASAVTRFYQEGLCCAEVFIKLDIQEGGLLAASHARPSAEQAYH